MNDEWTDRLSEYLDGDLDGDERTALEAHLASCEACTEALDGLRAVVARARHLPDREPATDLWPAIEKAMGHDLSDVPVIELASRRRPAGRQPRRVNLTVGQLVAAGLALVFFSGAGALMLRPDPVAGPSGGSADPALGVRAVADTQAGMPEADGPTAELTRLEELLATHRGELSPNTIRILEKNLAAIDRAIEESVQALAVDPGNTFLEGHLERSYEKKLEYLREASATFQWST